MGGNEVGGNEVGGKEEGGNEVGDMGWEVMYSDGDGMVGERGKVVDQLVEPASICTETDRLIQVSSSANYLLSLLVVIVTLCIYLLSI